MKALEKAGSDLKLEVEKAWQNQKIWNKVVSISKGIGTIGIAVVCGSITTGAPEFAIGGAVAALLGFKFSEYASKNAEVESELFSVDETLKNKLKNLQKEMEKVKLLV